jgi:hypothetical protein
MVVAVTELEVLHEDFWVLEAVGASVLVVRANFLLYVFAKVCLDKRKLSPVVSNKFLIGKQLVYYCNLLSLEVCLVAGERGSHR